MEIKAAQGVITETDADSIIVNLFEDDAPLTGAARIVDEALNGALSELIADGDLRGKVGQVGVIYPRGAIPAKRVLATGLGRSDGFDLERVSQSSSFALKKARELGARHVATIVHGADSGGLDPLDAAQAVVEGGRLGLYKSPKRHEEPWNTIESLTLVERDHSKLAQIEEGVRLGRLTTDAVYRVRDLVSYGPNIVTPSFLADMAMEIGGKYGMKVTLGDRAWAEERRMGAFLAVSKAAQEPARFIVMEHNAGRSDLDTLVLIGKGITFDTGGISLKPAEKMEEMKTDKAGAVDVIATMQIVGELDLPLHIVAIAPCTENMPGGGAYHPADIITTSNGKTIEIISTDAEGRLVLADALVYAQQFKPKAVVDLATLTGACVIALGAWVAAGLFCTDNWLEQKLVKAGQRMNEKVWPLPLWDEYKKKIKSLVADLANSGGRYGGVGSSAIFLKEFIDYPWAHIDMAGMVHIAKNQETPYTPFGATGYGVRLLVDFLRHW